MTTKRPEYRRGFKAQAERIAMSVRKELGIDGLAVLDVNALATHRGVRIQRLTDMHYLAEPVDVEMTKRDIQQIVDDGTAVSATTVINGDKALILVNDAHAVVRQRASICHEFAHPLLGHQPRPFINYFGCRDVSAEDEREADFLGFALLISEQAAKRAVYTGTSPEELGRMYGTSKQVAQLRINAHNWVNRNRKF